MRMSRRLHLHHRGFTIIELMIATVVFSLVLMIVIAGVLQFTRQYYKGVIASNTQDAARAVVDDITRSIQFGSKGSIVGLTHAAAGAPATGYCVGQTKRYSYSLNAEIAGSIHHALIADTVSGCGGGFPALVPKTTASLPANGRELLGDNMRISKFNVVQVGSSDLYNVSVRIVYGDDDLLCSPSIAPATSQGGCDPSAPDAAASTFNGKTDLTCRSTIGSQFCAVSDLSTTVEKRVQ